MTTTARGRRSRFLATLAAPAALAAVRAPLPAAPFEFKCASDLAPDHPSSVRLRQMWNAVERESNGRIRTQFFPAGQLGHSDAMFSQLRVGALEFFLTDSGVISAVVPTVDISLLGFVFRDPAEGGRAIAGPLGDYVRGEMDAKGIHAMRTVWNSGMLQIGSSARATRVPDDLRGQKLRVQPGKIAVDLFRALGASPTPISFSEVYTALQTKLIDGESAPLVTMEASRLYEVQKYVSLTNHAWSGLYLIASGEIWKRLPADLQTLVERINTTYATLEGQDTKAVNASVAEKLTRQGMLVNNVDPAPFRARLGAYYDSWQSTFGPTAWGLLQHALGRPLTG